MSAVRARIVKGRLVLDEPTTLPEGTIVNLVADGERRVWTNCASVGESAMPFTPPSVADAFRTTLNLFETGLDLMRRISDGVIPKPAKRKSSCSFTNGFWIAQEQSLATVLAGPST